MRSIIGRFLEHSRIFHFAAGHEDPLDGEFYIGSADWMFRNLSRRVEVVTPVTALGPKERLWEILDICLRDQRQAWILNSDGRYAQLLSERLARSPKPWGHTSPSWNSHGAAPIRWQSSKRRDRLRHAGRVNASRAWPRCPCQQSFTGWRFDEVAVRHPEHGHRDPAPVRITHESSPLSVTLLLEPPS